MFQKSLLVLFVSLTLASCGKSSRGEQVVQKDPEARRYTTQELMSNQKLTCESIDGGACPDGIIRMIIGEKNDDGESMYTGYCSAFLVGNKTVVTNNHCINFDTSSIDEVCESSIFLIYTSTGIITRRCQGIVETMKDVGEQLDYAVLELSESVDLKGFESSSLDVKVGDSATAWVVDSVGPFEARITELQCVRSRFSYTNDEGVLVNDKKDEVFYFDNCPVIPGNSGSPLLDNDGDVIGVVYGARINSGLIKDLPFNIETPLQERRNYVEAGTFATEVSAFGRFLLPSSEE